jgi:hypothetical protein
VVNRSGALAGVIKIHHTLDFDSRKEFVEKSLYQHYLSGFYLNHSERPGYGAPNNKYLDLFVKKIVRNRAVICETVGPALFANTHEQLVVSPARQTNKGWAKMKSLLLASVALIASTAVYADTVSFSNILGTWSNATPSGKATLFGAGTSNPQAYWGGNNPSNHNPDGDSGYTFQSPSGQPIVATVPPSPSPDFVLGTFQHLNNPIPSGSSITGINLTLTTDVKIDGTDEGILSFQFHFTHDETDNAASPCADGGHVGSGVDVNGCADHVTVNALSDTAQFTIGGDHYTIDIIGFEQGGVVTNGFWTEEGVTNTAELVANVTLFSDVVTTPAAPEPSTWAMGLIGFAGLGFLGFRRSRQPVATSL